jgi:hypothetical protein
MPSTITDRLNGLTTSVAIKAPCRVATTAAITLSGEQTIDGVAVVTGDRVLVKDQAGAVDNGIYVVNSSTWVRAPDFDGSLDAVGGTQLAVLAGASNANTYWRVDGVGEKTVEVDDLEFVAALLSDSAAAAFIQSGSGSSTRPAQDKMRERMSLADKGGLGDDTVQTTAFHDARDSLTDGGVVSFGAGEYRIAGVLEDRSVSLVGAGLTATFVKPETATGVALRGKFTTGSWNPVLVSDLTLQGIGTLQGTGYRAGSDSYAANDELVTAIVFDRVRGDNLDKIFEFPFGNIGKWFRDCVGFVANYHLWMEGDLAHTMNGGCVVVDGGHWWDAKKASVYFDGKNAVGNGQFAFKDGIRELNPGWVYFFKNMGDAGGLPGITIAREWNEANHTAGTVDVGGVSGAPGWGYFHQCSSVIVEDTPMSKLTLFESHVTSRNCDLFLFEPTMGDTYSTLINEQVRNAIGPTAGLTWSVGAILNPQSLNAPSYYMPRPVGLWPYTADVLFASHCQAVEAWNGTTSRNTTNVTGDPGLPWKLNSQDCEIQVSELQRPPFTFTVPEDKHVVVLVVAKLISGPEVAVQVNGLTGFGPQMVIDNDEWRTLTGVLYNTGSPVASEALYLSSTGTSVVRLGGYAAVQFDTAQEARAFINRGLFPAEDRLAYTITNTTPSRTLNADTAAGTASVGYTQAELQAVMNRLNALEKVVATTVVDQQNGKDFK